jgi:hypothetical protein
MPISPTERATSGGARQQPQPSWAFNPSVKLLLPASALLIWVGCTAENPQPPRLAQSPAAVVTAIDSSAASPAPGSVPVSDTIPQIDWRVFLDTSERTALRSSAGKASRLNGELHIQLLNGAMLTFRDDTTDHFRLPRYAGYFRTIHSHVVHGVPMEGSGYCLIVDDSTGDSTVVYGLPVPSPDGNRFVVMSMVDAGAGYDPELTEVWRMVGRKPEKEFSFNTEDLSWQPSDPVWRDSVTIDFTKNVFIAFSKPYNQTPGRLIRSGSNWIFRDSVSRPQ